jgi:hypothetical protein
METLQLSKDDIETLLTFLTYCEHYHPYYKKDAKRIFWLIMNQQQTLFNKTGGI